MLNAMRRPQVRAHFSADAPSPIVIIPNSEGKVSNDQVLCVRLDTIEGASTLVLIVNMSQESQTIKMDVASILDNYSEASVIEVNEELQFKKVVGEQCNVKVQDTVVEVSLLGMARSLG